MKPIEHRLELLRYELRLISSGILSDTDLKKYGDRALSNLSQIEKLLAEERASSKKAVALCGQATEHLGKAVAYISASYEDFPAELRVSAGSGGPSSFAGSGGASSISSTTWQAPADK